MSGILGWNAEGVYLDESKNGKLIESWVYQQLAAMADVSGDYGISHYRDNNKREIDFIVERNDGATLGIEVKAGTASKSDFKHLKWFGVNLVNRDFKGIVLYSGRHVLSFGENCYAVRCRRLAVKIAGFWSCRLELDVAHISPKKQA